MKLVNDGKSKVKYKSFLTVFYGLICLLSFKQIIAILSGNVLKTSQLVDNSSTTWTLQTLVNPLISVIIVILSIIVFILVLKKKLPKFNLIFPIVGLLFAVFWVYIIPYIMWRFTNSVEEFLLWNDIQDQYLIIWLIIEFLFSSWFLLKLWVRKGKKDCKRK